MAKFKGQKIFDIHLPPWKRTKLKRNKNITLVFVIKARLPSKKNNVSFRRGFDAADRYIKDLLEAGKEITWEEWKIASRMTKVYVIGNEEYRDLLIKHKEPFVKQMQHYAERYKDRGLIFPITKGQIKTRFYFRTKYLQDSINKEESILDLLKEVQIISDDNWFVMNPCTREADLFEGEISENIAEIMITLNL